MVDLQQYDNLQLEASNLNCDSDLRFSVGKSTSSGYSDPEVAEDNLESYSLGTEEVDLCLFTGQQTSVLQNKRWVYDLYFRPNGWCTIKIRISKFSRK